MKFRNPTLSRPAHWQRAAVGYRLADGFATVAILIPRTPSRGNDRARWEAIRIDATGSVTFKTRAKAVEWCEAAEWYGPVKDRIAA